MMIGRRHTAEETGQAFSIWHGNCGFDNINMDLIVGLPGEGSEEGSSIPWMKLKGLASGQYYGSFSCSETGGKTEYF